MRRRDPSSRRARPAARRRGPRRTSSCRPGGRRPCRMCVDQPGHGALAVRARDRDDRDPPVGVADPGRRRRPSLADPRRPSARRTRSCEPVRRARRAGETSRSARASAASAIVCARSAPCHGKVTIQWPGIRRAMDRDAANALAMVRRAGVGPIRRSPRRAVATLAAGTSAPRRTSAWRPGLRWPYQRPASSDRDLDLHDRLEPVDVRALEQTDLDQSHGVGQDSRRSRRRAAAWSRSAGPRRRAAPDGASDADRPPTPAWRDRAERGPRRARRSNGEPQPAYLADLERLVNIDCGSYTPAGVDEVGRFVAAFLEAAGAAVETRPDPAGRLGATVIGTWAADRGEPVDRGCS